VCVCLSVCLSVFVCVCVCVRERERDNAFMLFACMHVRQYVHTYVDLSAYEREREREQCVSVSVRVYSRWSRPVSREARSSINTTWHWSRAHAFTLRIHTNPCLCRFFCFIIVYKGICPRGGLSPRTSRVAAACSPIASTAPRSGPWLSIDPTPAPEDSAGRAGEPCCRG
jgi:hypothetical protein